MSSSSPRGVAGARGDTLGGAGDVAPHQEVSSAADDTGESFLATIFSDGVRAPALSPSPLLFDPSLRGAVGGDTPSGSVGVASRLEFPNVAIGAVDSCLSVVVGDGARAPPPSPVNCLSAPLAALTFGPESGCVFDAGPPLVGVDAQPGGPSPSTGQVGSSGARRPLRGGLVKKSSRSVRRRGVGVPAVPRRARVWRRCPHCGRQNNVRRLFCAFCFGSRYLD